MSPPTKSSFADSSSDEEEERTTTVQRPLSLARKLLKPKQRGVSISGPTGFRRISVAACESDGDDNDEDGDKGGFSSTAPSKAVKVLGLGGVADSSAPKLSRSTSISSASTASPRTPGSRYSSPLVQMVTASPPVSVSRPALDQSSTAQASVGLGIAVPPQQQSTPTATLSYNRSRRPRLVGMAAPQPSMTTSDPALVALQRAAAAASLISTTGASTSSQPLAPSRSHTSPELSSEMSTATAQRRPTLSKRSCSDGSLPSASEGIASAAPLLCPASSSSRDSSSSSYSSGSSYSTYSSCSGYAGPGVSASAGSGGASSSTSTSPSASPSSRPLSHISLRSSMDEGSREIAAVMRYLDGSFADSPTSPTATTTSTSPSSNVSVGLDVEQQEQDQKQDQVQRERKAHKLPFHAVTVPGWNFL